MDSADGAAVRIAITVGSAGPASGVVQTVIAEGGASGEGVAVRLQARTGVIFADLSVGVDLDRAVALQANVGLSNTGVKLHGSGFIVSPEQARELGLGRIPGLDRHIRHYRNGRDIVQSPRGLMVIDLDGLSETEVRDRFPEVFQHVYMTVKPERDQNREPYRRQNWWLFGRKNTELRRGLAGLPRYIATVETAKHRVFTFLDAAILPDNKLINIAIADAWVLGVLSSRVHTLWAMRTGSWLGVGNDSVYVKTRCFETFPFPADGSAAAAAAAEKAEQLDAHRKRQQALHPGLTLTNLYNVLERLRTLTAPGRAVADGNAVVPPGRQDAGEPSSRLEAGAPGSADILSALGPPTSSRPAGASPPPLTPKERAIHDQGLVSVLAQLHDELDAAVLAAYGWDDLIPALVGQPGGTTPLPDKPPALAAAEEELLARLLALNGQRAADEAAGRVHWLRQDLQAPAAAAPAQGELDPGPVAPAEPTTAAVGKRRWPATLPEQFKAVREVLAAHPGAATPAGLAQHFQRAPAKKLADLLETLAALGHLPR